MKVTVKDCGCICVDEIVSSVCESHGALYIDFRGWRFRPPFICMGCGVPVDIQQWAFSRSCGPCDVSHSRTRRVLYRCFSGPRELIDPNDPLLIPPDKFIDPKNREQYPIGGMLQEKESELWEANLMLREQQKSDFDRAEEAERRVGEYREYIGLLVDCFARLIMKLGYPPIETLYPDPAELKRVHELKALLFPEALKEKAGEVE